ncbi:hypothetical protein C1I95_06065 [Micromonospora craterilacus]|uniref:Uncharacterized protein n=1 Tax=Micromonospora craterilacus TaxID=1655439 RepID=A0A2W2EHN1_9ACTN|nr:hypothetical protein [Micromonospora craterilacus]PZG22151.1 hypothetical protein C1I95_06065 [Micromonospora craterilacus]
MTDSGNAPAPNPVARQDLAALVGLLATLEGELLAQEIDPYLAMRLAERLARVGLLTGDNDATAALPQALHKLNHRLRYALGEYAEPPD